MNVLTSGIGKQTEEKWPRQLRPRTNYLIHKIAAAWLESDGSPRFRFQHEDGREYSGPNYHRELHGNASIDDLLAESGMSSISEVRYVVAWHDGAVVSGAIGVLLPDLEGIETRCAHLKGRAE